MQPAEVLPTTEADSIYFFVEVISMKSRDWLVDGGVVRLREGLKVVSYGLPATFLIDTKCNWCWRTR